MSEDKRRPGRPATGQTPKRVFRMSDDEYGQIRDAAGLHDETVSEYMRRVLLRDARRVLKK